MVCGNEETSTTARGEVRAAEKAFTSNDDSIVRTDIAYIDTGACGTMCAHGDWIRASIYHGTRTCKKLINVRRAEADDDTC